jgi:hypothetical protein
MRSELADAVGDTVNRRRRQKIYEQYVSSDMEGLLPRGLPCDFRVMYLLSEDGSHGTTDDLGLLSTVDQTDIRGFC